MALYCLIIIIIIIVIIIIMTMIMIMIMIMIMVMVMIIIIIIIINKIFYEEAPVSQRWFLIKYYNVIKSLEDKACSTLVLDCNDYSVFDLQVPVSSSIHNLYLTVMTVGY